jgi:GT2 family glycosyltransferase
MIRRDVFQRAGLYNAAYFMYAEDVDLCRTVMDLGLRNYYVGGAVVVHHGGKSSGGHDSNGRVAVMMRESWSQYFELHRGRRYAARFKLAVMLQAACRLSLIATGRLMIRDSERRDRLSVAHNKWISVLRWAVGLESWSRHLGAEKPYVHAS